MIRRRPAHRLTSALIGAIVAAVGILTMALLSGRDLDTELIAIITLAAVGGWLLVSALVASRRPRSGPWAAEPDSSLYAGAVSTTPSADVTDGAPSLPHTDEGPLTSPAPKAATKSKRAD